MNTQHQHEENHLNFWEESWVFIVNGKMITTFEASLSFQSSVHTKHLSGNL